MPVCFVALAATSFTSPPAESRREKRELKKRLHRRYVWKYSPLRASSRNGVALGTIASESRQGAREKNIVSLRGRRCV